MPKEGDVKPCPLCEEEGREGTCTWTIWESTAGFAAGDGAMPDPTQVEEWQCDQNDQHNHRLDPAPREGS